MFMTAKLSKKICLLGDFAVGKTSLVRRFVYDRFDDKYISTIGVKVSRKTVAVPRDDEIVELTMMLWDLAGSEEFNRVRASYLRGLSGAILVCDLTRSRTLENLTAYTNDLRDVDSATRIIIAANKSDAIKRHQSTRAQVEEVAHKLDAAFYITSAKTGNEVEKLFRHLGRLLV
jgi:small GTP-binding protein